MNAKSRRRSTATFERCAELRERAGLDLEELMLRVGPKPAKASYQRLERGLAIQASNAFKIANVLNAIHKERDLPGFDVDNEVKYA